jgi:catechol 2,3-dioxygenase-like lactoylglutathione lyase family enzyme
MEKSVFKSVHPIGDTDPLNLPVADVDQAAGYYEKYLGFTVKSRSDAPHRAAVLSRDGIEIRLAENGGDPAQASCYISVSDVDLAFQELKGRGLDLSPIRTDNHNNQSYRVFFVRAPDGLCYCLGQPA